jgi:hypothetical protein
MRLPSRVMRPKEPDRDRPFWCWHGAGGFEAATQAYANFAIAFANNSLDGFKRKAILRRPEASGRVGLLGFSLGGPSPWPAPAIAGSELQ